MTWNAVITIFAAASFYNTKTGMANPSLSRMDYYNALLHSAPASSIQKLEHVSILLPGLFCRCQGGLEPHLAPASCIS